MKYLDINEFREFGYLHEVNRQFLHPLGLALVVTISDCGTEKVLGVLDNREDPEGIIFDQDLLDTEKVKRVLGEKVKRGRIRQEKLGFIVQPLASSPGED